MSAFSSVPGSEPPAQSDRYERVYVQPTLGHGLRIWWAFFWRNTLLSVVVLFILGVLLQILSVPPENRLYVVKYGQYVVSYLLAIFVLHHVIQKTFGNFRIKLMSIGTENPQVLAASRNRTLRVWWTYTWRTLLYVAIASVVLNVPLAFITGAVQMIFPAFAKVFSTIVGFVIGAVIGLFVIYSNILDEEIGDFCVTLQPNEEVSTSDHAAAAPGIEAA